MTQLLLSEVSMDTTVNGKRVSASPRSETMVFMTSGLFGNPGGHVSLTGGSMPDKRRGRKANKPQGNMLGNMSVQECNPRLFLSCPATLEFISRERRWFADLVSKHEALLNKLTTFP
jgi:hypothetical protein